MIFLLIQETKMQKDKVGKLSFSSNMSSEGMDLDRAIGGVLTLLNRKAFHISRILNEGNALL